LQTNKNNSMQNKVKFSVITIVKGREEHLHNLLQGVKMSSLQPDEIMIVAIDEVPELSGFEDLPIEIIKISSQGSNLPIAEARNIGAQNAKFDHLIFLDVDCIPHPLITSMLFTSSEVAAIGCPILRSVIKPR